MALTNVDIKNAKPRDKNYRLYDEKGLYLEVTTTGGRLWRLKYRFGGKEKRLAIGPYPEIGLKAAREARDSARSLRASGIDPSQHKKLQKAAETKNADSTFETLAREWHAGKSRVWSTIHTKNVLDRLTRNVFPYVGNAPIGDINLVVDFPLQVGGDIGAYSKAQSDQKDGKVANMVEPASVDKLICHSVSLCWCREFHCSSLAGIGQLATLCPAVHTRPSLSRLRFWVT